jgi:hypothetical protein
MPKVVERALKTYFRSIHSSTSYFLLNEYLTLDSVHVSYYKRFNFEKEIMKISLISKPTNKDEKCEGPTPRESGIKIAYNS